MEHIGEPALHWRDLSAEEVYHMAHLENEARDEVAKFFGRLAFVSNPLDQAERFSGLLANTEARAESWLADQAALRRQEIPEPQQSFRNDQPTSFQKWLNEQITVCRLPAKDIAQAASVSEGRLSTYRRQAGQGASLRTVSRLASAFADARGLKGEVREAFIADSLKYGNPRSKQ